MNPEQMVASRELCEQLYKIIGDRVETYFWWQKHVYPATQVEVWVLDHVRSGTWVKEHTTSKEKGMIYDEIPAYDTTILGRMLPATIGDKTWLAYFKSLNGYGGVCESLSYCKWETLLDKSIIHKKIHTISDACIDPVEKKRYFTEPNARIRMILHLHKEGLLNPEDMEVA